MSTSDETAKYSSLLATGERVLLVRQRHWLTFLEAGRWFVLALGIGLVVALLDQAVPDDGVVGFLGTLLSWGFVLFFLVGVIGVGWYYLVWRIERYLVDAAGDRVRRRDQQVRTGHLARRDHRHDRRPPWLGGSSATARSTF